MITTATREPPAERGEGRALFLARSLRLWERAAGTEASGEQRYRPLLEEIAGRIEEGTWPGVHLDDGGLPHQSDDPSAATWMDAVTHAGPVTPRRGCTVEVGALWYDLLAELERRARRDGDGRTMRRWRALRRRARRSFLERFWLTDLGHLADVWRDGEREVAVRPNQVVAAALEHSPLSRGQRTDVVHCVANELLTPSGLRTLSPKSDGYRSRYDGDAESRERACLDGFVPHLDEAGLGQVSEVFDGDPPHDAGGAIARAWNIAELLRVHRMLEEERL